VALRNQIEKPKEITMKARILHALQSAMLSVCLFIGALASTDVYAQTILYVHGDVGLALQEYPRCCDPPNCTQCDPSCGGVLCVNYCSSWEYPCKYLQDALARAQELLDFDPETPVHIWVAATAANNPYRPHMCSEYHAMLSPEPPAEPINPCAWGQQNPTGNSCDECAGWSFHLQNHVEIYGGFPPDSADENIYGTGGANFSHRDWQTHTTVLSGDLDVNSIFRLYCEDRRVCENGMVAGTQQPCTGCRPHPDPANHPEAPQGGPALTVPFELVGYRHANGVRSNIRHVVQATGDPWTLIFNNRAPNIDNGIPIINNRIPNIEDGLPIIDDRAPIIDNRVPNIENRNPIIDNLLPIFDNRLPIIENGAPIFDFLCQNLRLWAENSGLARQKWGSICACTVGAHRCGATCALLFGRCLSTAPIFGFRSVWRA
jgi:hypothetical protein